MSLARASTGRPNRGITSHALGKDMQLQAEDRAILADGARRLRVDTGALIEAIEHESVAELAAILGIDQQEAALRMDPIRRAVAIGDDWGAGCRLLTDDIRTELQAALRRLIPDGAYSTSSGGSQG